MTVPELITELGKLKEDATLRHMLVSAPSYHPNETEEESVVRRAKAESARDTYAYCIMRLRDVS